MIPAQSLEDLAIFGGAPLFPEPLHVGRPNLGNRSKLLERFGQMLDRRWFTNRGPLVEELEERLSSYLGVKHCVCLCNGTIALEIAIRALGLTGEVIVPSFTFIATAHALQWQEVTPVFCDIDPVTLTLDPTLIDRHVTPKTSGIIGVHLFGRPCDVDGLRAAADRHGLKLLFDAAHSFSCTYKGRMIGGFGDAEVFSFHATKFFNTFEGGAIATDDDELAAKVRLMSNFGFAGYDDVIYVGTNGKMPEVAAAMGLTGLESVSDLLAANEESFREFERGLATLPGVRLLQPPEDELCNFQYVVLLLDPVVLGLSRDQLVEILHHEGILARRYFYPGCHRMEPYRSHFPHAGLLLPVTEDVSERIILLPTGPAQPSSSGTKTIELIRTLAFRASEVAARLRSDSAERSSPEPINARGRERGTP